MANITIKMPSMVFVINTRIYYDDGSIMFVGEIIYGKISGNYKVRYGPNGNISNIGTMQRHGNPIHGREFNERGNWRTVHQPNID